MFDITEEEYDKQMDKDQRDQAVEAAAYVLSGDKKSEKGTYKDIHIGFSCEDGKCECVAHADGRIVQKWVDGEENDCC